MVNRRYVTPQDIRVFSKTLDSSTILKYTSMIEQAVPNGLAN